MPLHNFGGKSPVFHHRSLSSIPGQFMWDLQWADWKWDRFLSKRFSFPLSAPSHWCSMLIHLSPTLHNINN